MLYTCIAYSKNKNLGKAYNDFMELIPEDDWVCFLDHDAVFTTYDWYMQISNIIDNLPKDVGLLTAVTNRIQSVEQIIFSTDSEEAHNHDMYFHRKIGRQRQREFGATLREVTIGISGIIIVTSKKVWRESGGFNDGFLGVDNNYNIKVVSAGYKTMIMDGVYLYHWYRAAPSKKDFNPGEYKTRLVPIV
jgi:cellulose synthase/poly-beta-1,6-N-acetylglucosamine synthase-like glycosyltransferase